MSDRERKPMPIGMIEQFNDLAEKRKKAKESRRKGPVDLKAMRAQVKQWDAKNRDPKQ